MIQPFQLLPVFRERVWGRKSLAPFFPEVKPRERIGETWFTFDENQTSLGVSLGELISSHPEILGEALDPLHPGACPLLVKLLFTSERLSVQVHPDDTYAEQHHQSLGKTEAWYVLDAQSPGEIAIGFRETLTRQQLKSAAQSGEIEQLLDWRKVNAGDVVFVPAGTVHAIGAGLTICEIQENSDITYRLYDYGRPRELHLEHSIAVADLKPHQCDAKPVSLGNRREQLLECSYFRMERLRPAKSIQIEGGLPHYLLLICTEGIRAGQAWMIPARAANVAIDGGSEWILTYKAPEAAPGITA